VLLKEWEEKEEKFIAKIRKLEEERSI